MHLLKENICILIKSLLTFDANIPIVDKSVLVQVMIWWQAITLIIVDNFFIPQ